MNTATIKRHISLALAALLLLTCQGCKNDISSQEEYKKDVFAMDTFMTLKVYGSGGEEAVDEAKNEIFRLEDLFSATKENSDISKLNSSDGSPEEVSEETAELLRLVLEVGEKTGGALDPTVFPIVREWGFTTGKYHVPEKNTLDDLLKNVGLDKITLNGSQVTLSPGTEIDFGAAAKGYTGDRICGLLKKRGITSALINLGGNVQALGTKPDGSLWSVGIEDPEDQSRLACTVRVSDRAVITSGSYERFFEEDGKKYWHIIDPKTGYPADKGLLSVTVIGEQGVYCDALSTALFVMGTEKAIDFCREHPDTEAVLIDKANIYITPGIADSAEPSDRYNYTVIRREGGQ